MMASITHRLLFFALLALFVASCSMANYIILINNTGKQIQIQYGGKSILVEDGDNVRVIFAEELTKAVFTCGTMAFSYAWKYPPSEFLEKKKYPYGFVIQIEHSLEAYVVSPMTREIVSNMPSQPENFPLIPNDREKP